MSVKCSNCGLVSFDENQDCRRCGASLAYPAPGGWNTQPQNPGSIVDAPPTYGSGPAGNAGAPGWGADPPGFAPPPDGYGNPGYGNAGYGNQGYGGGYGSQAYGGTQGTYAPPYGQQGAFGGYSQFGYAGYAVQHVLADRGTRLAAALIDSATLYIPMFGLFALAISMRSEASILFVIVGLLYALGILVVQIVMLCQRGQSIGKRALGIRIVKMDNGMNGGGVTNVVLRGLVPGLIGLVPYVGPLFSLVNVCFIFAEDKRCLHDHIASTVVVQGDP
jgi:uncharacterized RDD family membrane protein YckC